LLGLGGREEGEEECIGNRRGRGPTNIGKGDPKDPKTDGRRKGVPWSVEKTRRGFKDGKPVEGKRKR